MEKCERCSHGAKSIYHVGNCPKGIFVTLIESSWIQGCELCGSMFACHVWCVIAAERRERNK